MKQFFSGLSFIVQAVLVVAAVLIFAYFDPFHIFINNKLSLRDTPSHVKQIRAIGELITAEYYGEVISSYKNIIEIQKSDAEQRLKKDIRELDSLFKNSVVTIKEIENKKDQKEQFENLCKKFSKEQPYFDIYLEKIRDQFSLKWYNGDKKLLEKLNNDGDFEKLVKNTSSYCDQLFNAKKDDVTKEYTKRKVQKSQLILLGRGKVQAGFKFNTLDERNVRIDTLHNRIIIIGMEPQILSCDINPWFVPELGIKGFEIIDLTRQANKVSILQQVKKNCLDSLRSNALASNILNIAKENAEQNLKQFFSLLLNNNDIEVKIVTHELDYYTQNLFNDHLLVVSELSALDSLTNKYLRLKTDSDKVLTLLDSIKHCKLLTQSGSFSITPYTLPTLKQLKDTKRCDSCLTKIMKYKNYEKWFYTFSNKKYTLFQGQQLDSVYQSYLSETYQLYRNEYTRLYIDTLKKK